MTYAKLKVGQAFMFEHYGTVFVRCKGGFRVGTGGTLHTVDGSTHVIPYAA